MKPIIIGDPESVLKQLEENTNVKSIFESVLKELEFGNIPKRLYNKLMDSKVKGNWVWRICESNEQIHDVIKMMFLISMTDSGNECILDMETESSDTLEITFQNKSIRVKNEELTKEDALYNLILSMIQ